MKPQNEVDKSPDAAEPRVIRRRNRLPQIPVVERRRLIIDAAEKAFLAHGYGLTSMDMVAAEAGMSKKTLYELFPSKDVLFNAIITSRTTAMAEGAAVDVDTSSLERGLASLLTRISRYILAEAEVEIVRLVIMEAKRDPALAKGFYEEGFKRGSRLIASFLKAHCESGALVLESPAEAANMLAFMCFGDWQLEVWLGQRSCPSESAIRRRVKMAVHIFLEGAMAPR